MKRFLHIAFPAVSARRRGQLRLEELSVAAKGAVLIDAKSGRVLFGQNENERFPMASTTKIMTALLALENCSLDEEVTASENASGVPGTSIYLGVGETLSMEEMLYGLLLRSGNDAAVAIAEHVSGSAGVRGADERARGGTGRGRALCQPPRPRRRRPRGQRLALARIFRQAMHRGLPSHHRHKKTTIPRQRLFPRADEQNRLLTTYAGATGGKTGYTSTRALPRLPPSARKWS